MLNSLNKLGRAALLVCGVGTSAFLNNSLATNPSQYTSFSMTDSGHTVHGYNEYTFALTGCVHAGESWEMRSTASATEDPGTGTLLTYGTYSGTIPGTVDVGISYSGAPYSMYVWIRATGSDEDTGWLPFDANAFYNTNACNFAN